MSKKETAERMKLEVLAVLLCNIDELFSDYRFLRFWYYL